MRYSKVSLFFTACFLFTVLAGCDKFMAKKPKEVPKETVVQPVAVKGTLIARINNYPVTLEDLNQEIEVYNSSMVPVDKPEMKVVTREQKVNYLKNELVRKILFYQEALAKGLDRKEETVMDLERNKRELLVIQLVKEEVEKIEVSSSEIEDYYNAYKEQQLKETEERQVREIMVSTEQEAKDILIQLLQGADFATLAQERSKAASAKDGGDLGFIKKNSKFSQFDSVTFSESIDVGKISNIFKGPEGYYIIKIEGKRGGKQKSLTELWDDIKRLLTFYKLQERNKNLLSDLSKNAKIEIYEGEVK